MQTVKYPSRTPSGALANGIVLKCPLSKSPLATVGAYVSWCNPRSSPSNLAGGSRQRTILSSKWALAPSACRSRTAPACAGRRRARSIGASNRTQQAITPRVRTASRESLRCGADTTIITLASCTGTSPTLCTIATPVTCNQRPSVGTLPDNRN